MSTSARFDSPSPRGPKLTAAIAVLLACSATSAAGLSLVTNGGFEQNTSFVERPDLPRVADLSGSVPTGWTRDSGDLAEYMTQTPPYAGLTLYNPVEGNYFIGAHDGEWWEQTFATTPGVTYSLTYSSAYGSVWWTNLGSYYRPGVLPGQVTFTGNSLLLAAPWAGTSPAPTGSTLLDMPFVWSRHEQVFVADSNSATLRFAGSTTLDGGFVFVDDVAIAAIPEPLAAWLLLLGLPLVCVVAKTNESGLITRRQ
jgi:hypothetical protein